MERDITTTTGIRTIAGSAMKKALRYVADMQEENGGWSRLRGEFPAESEPTSWAVIAFSAAGSEAERVARGIDFILKDQRPDGSWNGNSAHTAFVLLALAAAKAGGKETVRAAVEYLRGVQVPEGGFRRLGDEGVPLAVYTANVLNGLKAAGLPASDPMAERALDWLLSCQNPDGGFGMAKGTDSVALSTAWTITVLRNFGMEPTHSAVQKAASWLLDRQHESGGFANTAQGQEDPEITSLALLALRTLPRKEGEIEKAVTYLGRVQDSDGSYTGNTPMQFKGESKKNTQTTVFVAWALSQVC